VGDRAWPGCIMLTDMPADITWQRGVHAHSSVLGSASPAPATIASKARGGGHLGAYAPAALAHKCPLLHRGVRADDSSGAGRGQTFRLPEQ